MSSRTLPVPTSSMSQFDSNSERSFLTNTSSLIPPISIPKNFNIPFAIQHGYFRCVRYLLELSHDPNERDSQLHTPLILCAYIENDRWSLSIAQNLLEKRAKIPLADHARRNAMHHACALQRIHLVRLYLSNLEFDMEAKDCDGNTYLHYAAITGNCEIAELLIRIADKMGIRIDQIVNREGCAAAVLALRYGHIECANQITHRDWDEFFVVPRPLSVYETASNTDANHISTTPTTTTTISKQRNKLSHNSSRTKNDIRPSALSFGLLKIMFNESDTKYSTHLAKLCDRGKQNPNRRPSRAKNQDMSATINKLNRPKSAKSNGTPHSSVGTITTDLIPTKKRVARQGYLIEKANINSNITHELPPRIPSAMPQTKDRLSSNGRVKPKINTPISQQQHLDSSNHHYEPTTTTPSSLFESPQTRTTLQRPKSAIGTRNKIQNNTDDVTTRLYSRKIPPSATPYKKLRKKSTSNTRPKSASSVPKQPQQHSNLTFESSTYSKTLFTGRPLSAVLQNHHCRSPVQQIVDPSCSIREAHGAASRYNNPEELFGIKPEELFGAPGNPSKNFSHRDTRLKRHDLHQPQPYMYQQDVDKLSDLYALQHTSSYRPAASAQIKLPLHTGGLKAGEKHRKISSSKGSINSRTSTNTRLSTLAALNITRRFSNVRQPTTKTVHT